MLLDSFPFFAPCSSNPKGSRLNKTFASYLGVSVSLTKEYSRDTVPKPGTYTPQTGMQPRYHTIISHPSSGGLSVCLSVCLSVYLSIYCCVFLVVWHLALLSSIMVSCTPVFPCTLQGAFVAASSLDQQQRLGPHHSQANSLDIYF